MYQIIIKKKAKKFIDKLPKKEKIRVVSAIEQLPNGEDIKKLKGNGMCFYGCMCKDERYPIWTSVFYSRFFGKC